jgi:type 1 fimbria pilin
MLARRLLLAPARPGRVATLAVALGLLLAFGAIALDSSSTVVTVNEALQKDLARPLSESEIGLLLSADGELRMDGEIAAAGTAMRGGGRLDVVRGDAVVRFGDVPIAVLHEGASVTFDSAAEATLHHGSARFEVTGSDDQNAAFRVHAGHVDVDAQGTVLIIERTRTDDRVLVVVREGDGAEVITPNGRRSLRSGEETTVVRGRIGPVRTVAGGVARAERAEQPGLGRLKRRAGRLLEIISSKSR